MLAQQAILVNFAVDITACDVIANLYVRVEIGERFSYVSTQEPQMPIESVVGTLKLMGSNSH